jgi:hypothetical protein
LFGRKSSLHRPVTLSFDGQTSCAYSLNCGLAQGCPSSAPLFLFYNAPLLREVKKENGEDVSGFMDNVTYMTRGPTAEQVAETMTDIMVRPKGALSWSLTHRSNFSIPKFAFMIFTRKRERYLIRTGQTIPPGSKRRKRGTTKKRPVPRPSITIQGTTIPPSETTCLLGVILNQELRFKAQITKALKTGQTWFDAFKRFARPSHGISVKYARMYWLNVAIPKMFYAAEVWMPIPGAARGSLGPTRAFERIQRQAAIHITGALRTTPSDLLYAHADLLPMLLQIEKLLHRATTRLASLPPTHPLHRRIQTPNNQPTQASHTIYRLLNGLHINPRMY